MLWGCILLFYFNFELLGWIYDIHIVNWIFCVKCGTPAIHHWLLKAPCCQLSNISTMYCIFLRLVLCDFLPRNSTAIYMSLICWIHVSEDLNAITISSSMISFISAQSLFCWCKFSMIYFLCLIIILLMGFSPKCLCSFFCHCVSSPACHCVFPKSSWFLLYQKTLLYETI